MARERRKTTTITWRLDDDVVAALQERADRERLSVTAVGNRLLAQALGLDRGDDDEAAA